ncbi:glycosyltransferase family 2 protein [Rhodococcus sp. (in: high G+C Gram-positive bacteria)]|uniref:glycosyltransferase family 2 protein n=1 Tax=Rhodococcus sp. TaxID=1831 RepID=UPI003BAFE676
MKVSVVVVTYNSAAVIGECVRPLSRCENIELVVLDNASSDHTLRILASEAPDATVIRSDENLGFAKGVNLAVGQARGDAVLLLNPDARISAEEVLALAQTMEDAPDIGIIAPTLTQPTGRLTIREGGRQPDLISVFNHYSGLSRLSNRYHRFEGLYLLHTHDLETRDVDWVSGACMMIRREIWDALQGLTERWFMYAEDLEFCLRVRQSGTRIVMSAEQRGTHVVGGSAGSEVSKKANPAWVVNLYDLYKWQLAQNRIQSLAWKASVTAGLLSRSAAFFLKSLRRNPRSALWRAESHKFLSYTRSLVAESSRIGGGTT